MQVVVSGGASVDSGSSDGVVDGGALVCGGKVVVVTVGSSSLKNVWLLHNKPMHPSQSNSTSGDMSLTASFRIVFRTVGHILTALFMQVLIVWTSCAKT